VGRIRPPTGLGITCPLPPEPKEEEEEEFFNLYKNDLKRHALTLAGDAGADLKSRAEEEEGEEEVNRRHAYTLSGGEEEERLYLRLETRERVQTEEAKSKRRRALPN
jgi:hypothetical protein